MQLRSQELLKLGLIAAIAVGTVGLRATEAAVIVSPVAATASNSFPDPTFGTVENLINQGGLLTPFISGVTDFDAYLAGDPQHTTLSAGAEWFTDFNQSGATLTFDLGAVMTIDRLAVWVDEFWGVGTISVFLSLDGVTYGGAGSFAPTDWPTNVTSYGADVFAFGAAPARFVQLLLSDCPQPLSEPDGGCGLGEVAFSQVNGIPEPGTLALLGVGAGLTVLRRRR